MAKLLQQNDGVISFEILVNGSKINDLVEVLEITTQMEVNRISSATLLILDGGAIGVENEPFTNSEGNDFIPGNEISIAIGYDGKNKEVFSGIISAQGLSVSNGNSQLTVRCKDKAVKMTKGRLNSIAQNQKDSDILSSIASAHGLQSDIAATTTEWPGMLQFSSSDWDFTVIRAEMNNMMVLTDLNKLIVKEFDFSGSPKAEINASQYIINIDLNLDSESIADTYELNVWDDKTQAINTITASINDELAQGNLSAEQIAQKVNIDDSGHFSSATLPASELTAWGKALTTKAVLSKIQGRITIPGTSEIKAGDLITISGFSARFNGKAFVSKVVHTLRDGDWITLLSVGRPAHWHSSLPDVEDRSASGLIPAVSSPQIAKVKKIHEDPDGNYRVLVNLPAFSGKGMDDGIWARLAFPYASNDAGFFFFPETGDEVLVTFLNNDPRFPVITGALYSSKNLPKEVPDEKNKFKAIYTKSGIKIRFDDEDKILLIDTPGGNSFTLDDKNKTISLKDMSDNSVVLDSSGIALKSAKDIKLTADGNIDITAVKGINLKAGSDLKAEGLNVQLSAQVGLTAKGTASAELSASGQTTLKGAMVMIN